jgi:serine/threonine-protein kinase
MWLADVARALAGAHAVGLVHRDVKPENVMIRDDGVVKVLDFGIARRTRLALDTGHDALRHLSPLSVPPSSADMPTLTRRGAIVGTPAYMAPEQIRGEQVDGRADQFSWGVLAYEVITGQSPWPQGKDAVAQIACILSSAPTTMLTAEPELDPLIEQIVFRALAKAPGDRFATMDALVAALEGETLSALSPLGRGSARYSPPPRELRAFRSGTQDLTRLPNASLINATPTLPSSENRLGSAMGDALAEYQAETGQDGLLSGERIRENPPRERSASGRVIQIPSPSHSERRRVVTGDREPINTPQLTPPPPMPSGSISAAPEVSSAKSWMPTVLAGIAAVAALAAAITSIVQVSSSSSTSSQTTAHSTTPVASLSSSSSTVSSTIAASVPTAVTALPLPTACNPAALTEYRAGVQELHDATWEAAHARFEKAVQLDPSCAEAHLRLVVTGHWFYPLSRQREVFQRALQLRAQLGPRDRTLLASYEPATVREPPETAEVGTRLSAAIETYPDDAELRLLIAMRPDLPVETRLMHGKRGIELDPTYADALQIVARLQVATGHPEEALASLEGCLKVAPAAADCRLDRTLAFRHQGRCADMAAEARRWSASDPGSSLAYELLAGALASQNAPREAIEEALRQRWARLPEGAKVVKRKHDEARLAALQGDFDEVLRVSLELEKTIEQDPNLETHLRPAMMSLEALVESGQRARAASLASTFLRRKDVWIAGAPHELRESGAWYFEPRMLAVLHREGKLNADEMARSLVTAAARPYWDRPADDQRRWVLSSAIDIESADDARAALRTMPGPASAFVPTSDFDHDRFAIEIGAPFVGRALLLAGDIENTIAVLRPATALCGALDNPFVQTRAFLSLGEALEHKGDRFGACAAYKIVVNRWGKAKPRSLSADEAKLHIQKLACPDR